MYLTSEQFAALMPDGSQLLSDEPEMESSVHYAQLALLVACLEMVWGDRDNFFIGANLTIYFSRQQLKNRDVRGPDFFLIKNTERRHRSSWVVWEEEGRYPSVIIELLSASTAGVDRGLKKTLYQDRFRTPEYFWFGPGTLEFEGFRLVGAYYVAIPANENGWRWSEELGLYLGIWEGQLRYFTEAGELVPTPEEARQREQLQVVAERSRAEAADKRAEAERERAEAERERAILAEKHLAAETARAIKLADYLRSQGLDPDNLPGLE